MTLLEETLAAHGGRHAWESAREVTAQLRSGGLALGVKGAGEPFRSYEASVSMGEARTVVTPYPEPGSRGIWEGDTVRIEADAGATVAERAEMRRRFPGLRRRLRWDPLDGLYFAGYALWNYFNTPLLLTRAQCHEDGRKLRVIFPPEIPTHSRKQVFHFDAAGLLERIDYTAEVFGLWARAKHLCSDYRSFDGLSYPTRRRVTPRGAPAPTLVWIDLDGASVRRA